MIWSCNRWARGLRVWLAQLLVHAQHPGQRSFAADGGVCPGAAELGPKSVLPALAATCCQMLFFGGLRESVVAPEPIAGRGVKGRLLARITLALDLPAPTGWTAQLARGEGAASCAVIHPDQEPCKNRPLCLRCEQRSLDALLPCCLGALVPWCVDLEQARVMQRRRRLGGVGGLLQARPELRICLHAQMQGLHSHRVAVKETQAAGGNRAGGGRCACTARPGQLAPTNGSMRAEPSAA